MFVEQTNLIHPVRQGMIKEAQFRLQSYSQEILTTAELLAILTGNPLSVAQLQERFKGNLRDLSLANWQEIAELAGISEMLACRILAALELGKRLVKEERPSQPQITSPELAAELLMVDMRDLKQEHLRVLVLDTKNHVILNSLIYVGNVNTSVIRVAEVLRPAILHNAPGLIVAHNHPSGGTAPSPEDLHITRKIYSGARLVDIELLDHLIIGANGWSSVKEHNPSLFAA